MPKISLGVDVLSAAQGRVKFVFDNFSKVYVSFSGGKDSSALLHLAVAEAKSRSRKIGVLFIDWECQFNLTCDFIQSMYDKYAEHIEPYWVCLPIKTDNSCSQLEPEFTAWDEAKKDLWVRDKPKIAIKDGSQLPFFYPGMTFEEFVPAFGQWYADGQDTACLVGIRSQESLNRFRAIARIKDNFQGKKWTTHVGNGCWNAYPIYDWDTQDIWTYFGKTGNEYTPLYDRMYQANVPLGSMRIDEPFGDTQRKSLWLYQVVESETWGLMTARLSGVNTAGLYGRERGAMMGNTASTLPEGHTWESFSNFLLGTMPPATAEHYRNKIAVYIQWHKKRGYDSGIPDFADMAMENKNLVPSWRRICKTLLRNDYWCRWLGFSPTKTSAYEKYVNLMKKRRKDWGIYGDEKAS